MSRWNLIVGLAFVLILGLAVKWYVDGCQVFTKDARQVVVRDDLFGTNNVEWEKGVRVGLDLAGPTALALAVLGGFGIHRGRQAHGKRKTSSEAGRSSEH